MWKLLYGRRASGRPSSEFERDRAHVRPSTPGNRETPYDIAKVMSIISEEFNRAGDAFPFLPRPY